MFRISFGVCCLVCCVISNLSQAQTQATPASTPVTGANQPGLNRTPPVAATGATTGAPNSPLSVQDLTMMLRMIDPYRKHADLNGTIKVYGSTAMDAMAHMWADQFKLIHQEVKVEIAAAGSGDAFEQLKKDPTAIAMLSRPVTNEELQQLKSDRIKNPAAFVVAREALGVYVHESNPAKSISADQLRMIFTNQLPDSELKWKLLGVTGPMAEQPIRLVARSESSGTQQFLRDYVFTGLQMRTVESGHASNTDALAELAKDPLAITICGLRASGKSVRVLPLMSGGMVISSDDASVFSGQYPLTRNMTLVIDLGQKGPAAAAAQDFVFFAVCQYGQVCAIKSGFFPADLNALRTAMTQLQADHIH